MRVLLGVSGGIAAYKTPDLVRRLRERGAEVRCAVTRSASSFVSPLALEVVSGHAVGDESYLTPTGSGVEQHIELAQWAEVALVAPATAHVLARLSLGLADDFLTTTLLGFGGDLFVAPAMHTTMWSHAAVREHVARLEARGVSFLGPVAGALASGETGLGRMLEPVEIAAAVAGQAAPTAWSGRTVLVTAGPTHEAIDPVRYIANRSSGKMGFAVAAEAAARGARVVLVAGPVSLPTPHGVVRVDVETAAEMAEAVATGATDADVVVMAAAVADFRPRAASQKLKKTDGIPELELEPTSDIVSSLSGRSDVGVVVAFAAETQDVEAHAVSKLERKGADLIVANDVGRSDIGFTADENEVTVIGADGSRLEIGRRPKSEVAAALLDHLQRSYLGG